MSQENVEIVRRCYELWESRDWSAIPEVFDPHVEIDLSRNIFNPDVYQGHAGVERYVRVVEEVWDDFKVVPAEFIDAGDNVVTAVTVRGKGKGSGVDVKMDLFNIWTLRDSRVARVVGGYRDRSEALEAAGLAKQGSEDNVEKLRAFLETWNVRGTLEAWNRGDADLSLLDPEITYEDTILPDHVGETYRGYEGVARATERWLEPYEALAIELREIVGTGDRLVSIHNARAKARHTGIEFASPLAYFWTFRDGRVIHLRSYWDPKEALEAAGLAERD
jgi:ketosteroid isomerase-like protein